MFLRVKVMFVVVVIVVGVVVIVVGCRDGACCWHLWH